MSLFFCLGTTTNFTPSDTRRHWAMKGMDLEGQRSVQDKKLMLQRIGMFGDANDGGGRGRTHSRGSSRSVSFGADGGVRGGGAAPTSPGATRYGSAAEAGLGVTVRFFWCICTFQVYKY